MIVRLFNSVKKKKKKMSHSARTKVIEARLIFQTECGPDVSLLSARLHLGRWSSASANVDPVSRLNSWLLFGWFLSWCLLNPWTNDDVFYFYLSV